MVSAITEETFKTPDGVILNWVLAQEKGLTVDEIQAIMDCHIRRVVIFDAMKKTNGVKKLHAFADEIEELEFEMQAHWHFVCNRDYHLWWMKSPKCKCPPKLSFGTNVFDNSCPVHG